MPATIIDGKQIGRSIRESLKPRIQALQEKGCTPGLAVILVGEDPASASYVAGKEKACLELGMHSRQCHLPAQAAEAEVLATVAELNRDPAIHGILVQLPLPKHVSEARVIACILPEKDVDGFTPVNVGRMVLGERCFLPCTPHGIIKLLQYTNITTKGAHAVVVGRSNIVGKPLANLLVRKDINATVTVCHTGTRDLAEHTRRADILVACAGLPELIKADMIKPGACVIDVGVNRVDAPDTKKGWRLVGDVAFDDAVQVAGSITPVPGGVGPLTITMLLFNTVEAAELACGLR
ncbi:MAG: bifunctional 5,10-methylene-tetrahydrofolate dehydrogenase/5,10-methylene-tetrahydrofolate cyclohydrolase [Spirochaetes bacterium GWD1_61_31]|nr:MAG: bifunctional 5,10-methylene-tetrahydrofolate dehydrogenase/5,10-methylene-tetrahydrofolate cyclohydrolase [Spirochaetes bacterium GWB1_60_80]OHD31498.1 MAG: bifunctional 5,10-methylene-tetrahydrofolate dehydrogenase/5,10-methylene-tetrahydrofolate cyclohydrolase [Spirochaetes bacterium GWC1_61_12]OHD43274.1 MAG: bifunctional 5,10-methylene-tetrahydrofolate dehydrogenase/5,10-methylene-tetrahydrofolate cyclohydrolase [Spirochaetes bacterium GWD1_61_31]OHD45636.1 MAG: bifunctional 5,10-met